MGGHFQRKSRIIMFFLMHVFGPFYLLWWQADTQNAFRRTERKWENGLKVVLLNIFTFGIYGVIWQFGICKKIKRMGGADLRAACIILYALCLIGIIVVPLLIQGEINFFANNKQLL